MSTTEITHPADRAVHAVTNATQIARALYDADTPQDVQEASLRIAELLADVPADIAALHQLTTAQADEMLELRKQGLRDTHCINRLEELNTKLSTEVAEARRAVADAQRAVEDLVRDLAPALEEVTHAFNFANRIRSAITTAREPHSVTLHEPRVAAAGGQ